jgi:hypothetical protein
MPILRRVYRAELCSAAATRQKGWRMSVEVECTDCGKVSLITFSAWIGPDGATVIRADESLCPQCAKVRGIDFFNSPCDPIEGKQ